MPAIQERDFNLVAPKKATKQTGTTEYGSADEGFAQPKAFPIDRELSKARFEIKPLFPQILCNQMLILQQGILCCKSLHRFHFRGIKLILGNKFCIQFVLL